MRKIPLVVASAVILMSLSSEAQAKITGVTKVSSSGTGLSASTTLGSLVKVNVGPLAKSQGTAPNPYNLSATDTYSTKTVALGESLNIGTIINLGALSQTLGASQGAFTCAICSSAVSGFTGSNATDNSGIATVNNLNFGLVGTVAVITSTLVGLNADTVNSNTMFNGQNFIQSSNITNLNLNGILTASGLVGLLGGTVDANANAAASFDPNTVLLNIPGLIRIVANEQFTTTSDVGNLRTVTATTNALHITLSDVIGGGHLLNGDVTVSQSTASFTRAIPEASTWMMMILGIGALGGTLRSRNRAKLRGDFGPLARVPIAA